MPRDRKSLEEHELSGTKPQYVLPDTADAPAGRPKYPKGISGEAKSAFKRLVKMLEARKVLTSADQEVLRLYAILFDRHERARLHIAEEGEIVESEAASKTGAVYTIEKENPWLAIAQNCERNMAALLQQLGLTPRTRTQVKKVEDGRKPTDATFPTREEAVASAPASDADILNSIDESKVNVN
jgi:P27 family predicted phage terminase small subunit